MVEKVTLINEISDKRHQFEKLKAETKQVLSGLKDKKKMSKKQKKELKNEWKKLIASSLKLSAF